ncbi:MAG: signal peptide peptidase SppA [Tepidisphaeraceae bacterium]
MTSKRGVIAGIVLVMSFAVGHGVVGGPAGSIVRAKPAPTTEISGQAPPFSAGPSNSPPRLAPTTKSPATAPSTRASTQPTRFPTPNELLEKMRATKKAKDALPHVAYIDIAEPIVEKPADFSLFGDPDALTLRSLLDRLAKAKDDKQVRAVLITLGAGSDFSFAQAQELRDAIAKLGRAGKKTFVYADAYDTPSYTIASAASHVCLLEGGQVMIPGVGMEAMFARGLLDKVGVKADYVQIGEYKGADEQYTRTAASEQLKGEMNKLADALYQQIVDGISLHRNLPKQDVKSLIDDALLPADVAKSRGLVDHLIDQDDLRDFIADELGSEKIELMHHYGRREIEPPDLSNPFSFFASMAQRQEPESDKPKIALVYVDGVITDGEGGEGMFGGNSAGSEQLRKALRSAARDEEVEAVVIRIDSPGGSALASEVIWQAARRVADEKPLIISIGGMAASGGYYIASAGDFIFADAGAVVGSIGVVGGKFVWGELAEKLGVTTETFSKGRNADLFSSSKPFDERQRKMVTTWMKQTYDQFIDRIQTTRKDSIKHIDDVARGRIFDARQGKNLGLVDEIGGLSDAIAFAATEADLEEGDYDVRVLPQPRTLADLFTDGVPDAASPLRPQVNLSPDSLVGVLDRVTRRALGQQLQALQLLQRHPVLLVSPYVITVR